MNSLLALAFAPPPGADGAPAQQSSIFMFVWLGIMILLFYFILIRPQKKREKERQELLSSIKSGDKVVVAGICGTVSNVKDDGHLVVKIADGVKIEVLRGAVSQVTRPESAEPGK